MASKSETVLQALNEALAATLPRGAKLLRNAVLPERIPAKGLVILRDGSPGSPEALLSPPLYVYEHRAEIDVLVEGTEAAREAAFDTLKLAIHAAIDADRTLGGICDYVMPELRWILPQGWLPYYALALALLNIWLRTITTTPVGRKEP